MFKNQLRVFLSQLALDKAISAANSSCSTTPIFVHPTLPGLSSSANYTIDVRSTTHSHHYTVEPFQVSVIEANTTSGSRISHNTSVNGKRITFSLDGPKNVVVQVNGNIWEVLHLLVNPIETDVPDPNDANVVYFSPGLNNNTAATSLTNGELLIRSGETVYIAPGATFKVPLVFQNVSNSELCGRQILSTGALRITSSPNIFIRDAPMLNGNIGSHMSTDITHRNDHYGDSSNLTIHNAICGPITLIPFRSARTATPITPRSWMVSTYAILMSLTSVSPKCGTRGVWVINPGDSNLIQNIYVDGMRVESIRLDQLINMRVMNNTKYNTSPGRGIRNVYIKDLSYEGPNENPSMMLGYDEDRTISNVAFENLGVR
ncbi:pectin lyase-like protein [Penicillium soppii]|uniref:pectin lyase-like protein n=1 Tax=Penicillium soppii TaxID=69789 RepID=UPI00254873EE|nr:pectin lyase-like protein [Penicillium soppii]KAJ5851434.1 pectin lyase-like protein [Penicillium soppii]